MSHKFPGRRAGGSRFRVRRYRIPVTALSIAAAVLLLNYTGCSAFLEQKLQTAGGSAVTRVLSWIRGDASPGEVPATDGAAATLYNVCFEEEFPGGEPVSGGSGSAGNVQAITITGTGSGYQSVGTVSMKNQTEYSIDTAAMLAAPCPVSIDAGDSSKVQVLIMHTHGTEAYTPDGSDQYTASGDYRTTDSSQNMLRVGEEIAGVLRERGIGVVHSTTLNDYPAYSGAYTRALKDIQAYLKEYPEIKVVIDVHRDALISNGTVYKTVAELDGVSCAQLMFVTGTDGGSLSHPSWQQNATFQVQLYDRMNSRHPGIMRPMSFRTGRFNQHLTLGSMLVEVGACGNTLQEALLAGRLFAGSLADALLPPA